MYSSHLLEHFAFREIQAMLDECLRVLKPGGYISVCVPDARLYVEAYIGLRSLDPAIYMTHTPAFNSTTKIDFVNYMDYTDVHHKYMWDEDNLLHVLAAKGFRDVRKRDFDPNLDQLGRDYESIYAVAIK